MTPTSNVRSDVLSAQIWQLDAAAQLLATLDERYAVLRAAADAPLMGRKAIMAQLDTANTELCEARAGFLDAVCQLQIEQAKQLQPFTRHECMFDALGVLWDFEAAWEDALEKSEEAISSSMASAIKENLEDFENEHTQ